MDADLAPQSDERSIMSMQADFDELKESRQYKATLPALHGPAVLAKSWYQARFFFFFPLTIPCYF